jgi:hypothetical protein
MDYSATPNDLPGRHQEAKEALYFAASSGLLVTRAVLTSRREIGMPSGSSLAGASGPSG